MSEEGTRNRSLKDVATPAIAATIPAETGWTMVLTPQRCQVSTRSAPSRRTAP